MSSYIDYVSDREFARFVRQYVKKNNPDDKLVWVKCKKPTRTDDCVSIQATVYNGFKPVNILNCNFYDLFCEITSGSESKELYIEFSWFMVKCLNKYQDPGKLISEFLDDYNNNVLRVVNEREQKREQEANSQL